MINLRYRFNNFFFVCKVKKSLRKSSPSIQYEISKSSNPSNEKSIQKTNDENMMAILSKMSAAYTNVKNENKNLLKTIETLKSENATLRDILSKVDSRISKKAQKEAVSVVEEERKSRYIQDIVVCGCKLNNTRICDEH